MSKTVRTRFAPSPTGRLHIGGARTALFAYLWAKKNRGQFILRIEDTDQERYVEGGLESFIEGLRWLGIEWDEGPEKGGPHEPYFQSKRTEIYKEYVDKLLDQGKAYRCFCTKECLQQMREEQEQAGHPPQYDQRCQMLSEEKIQQHLSEGTPYVVRLLVPKEGSVRVTDELRGPVDFDCKDIDDQVLMKSDGFPTYHLANVVDDHLMGVTHVIRGEEWLPSTPKHVLLYQAFGWDVPAFVHLSLFLSKQGGKMSKRHGETSLLAFRDNGYLPEAIVNFIALLGWNPKTTEEFFTLDELARRFELKQINTANPVFEAEKLEWMNHHYLIELSVDDILRRISALSEIKGEHREVYAQFSQWFASFPSEKQKASMEHIVERSKTLLDVAQAVSILQDPEYKAEDLIWKKSDKNGTIESLTKLSDYLGGIEEDQYVNKILEQQVIDWISKNGMQNGDVLWPMRFALSGEKKSPTPFELADLLGKENTLQRINSAIERLKQI